MGATTKKKSSRSILRRDNRILKAFSSGMTTRQIEEREGISRQRIHAILKRFSGRASPFKKFARDLRAKQAREARKAAQASQQACREALGIPLAKVAEELGANARCLLFLVQDGRVPFINRFGSRWYMDQRSVDFLQEWPMNVGGKTGSALAAEMRRAAAELDPACAERQRGAKPAKRPRRPKRLAQIWDRTVGSDVGRTLQFFAHLGKSQMFKFSTRMLAVVSRMELRRAVQIMRLLEEHKVLSRHGGGFISYDRPVDEKSLSV